MKTKEYIRLARISLKSRKKTTRSTVTGIVFGLIMLVPILFLGLGLNGDLQKQINKNPQLLYANLSYAKADYNIEDSAQLYVRNSDGSGFSYDQVIGNGHKKALDALENEKINYIPLLNSNLNFYQGRYTGSDSQEKPSDTKYSINGGAFVEIKDTSQNYSNLSLTSVVDLENNKTFIPSSIKDAYVEGFNKGFEGDGKGQVIVSEALLKTIGKTPSDVYGKKLSISYLDRTSKMNSSYNDPKQGSYNSANLTFDSDNDPNNVFNESEGIREVNRTLFSKFEVVGVLSEKYNKTFFGADHIMASSMIVSKSSVYTPEGKSIKPTFKFIEEEGSYAKTVVTYAYSESELEQMSSYVTIGVTAFTSYTMAKTKSGVNFFELENTLVLGKNYNNLSNACKDLSSEFSGIYDGRANSQFIMQFASETFYSYNMIYTIFMYLALVMATVGGIVFFSAMVNLFNTIMHSVGSRKNYLGVMRAIGAQDNVIPKLYVFETLAIFARALLWVFLIGGGICVGIKIGIDYLFAYLGDALGLSLSIGWGYIGIVFAIVIAVLLFFGWLFSFACSYRVAKQPITEVLEG